MTIGSDGLFSGNEVGAVERMMAGIVFPRAPGVELGLGRLVERRRQRDDRSHVQIGVGPSIQPPADALREGVVDRWSGRART